MPTFNVKITVHMEITDIEADTVEDAEVIALNQASNDLTDIPLYEFECDLETVEQVA